MAHSGGADPILSSENNPAGLRPWRLGVVGVAVVIAVATTLLVGRQAENEADERQQVLATEASVLVQSAAESSISAIAGAGGLVSPDGNIELEGFRVYAREVVSRVPLEVLALVLVVDDRGRAQFEERIGGPIRDQVDGELVPAGGRPVYFPIRLVEPEDAETRAVLGFDILADAVRGTAAIEARDTGRTVLTEPVRAAISGELSFFVVKPLYQAGVSLDTTNQRLEANAGFVTTVYAGDNLVDVLMAELPEGSRFTLRDGDVILSATQDAPQDGVTTMVDVAGRSWELVIEDGRGVDRGLQRAVAAFAVLLLGGLVLFVRRADDHERATRRSAQVIGRTADVAQALAAAGTVEEVDLVLQRQLPRVLDARAASIGMVDLDAGVLRLGRSIGAHPGITEPGAEVSLDQIRPLTEVVRRGEPVLLRTIADWREHAPDSLVQEVIASGLVSTACFPLEDRHGQVAATLAISWDHEVDFDAPTLGTLRTLTELCEYTLDRARTTDEAARHAVDLAQLAAQLAAAARVSDVLDIIVNEGASPVGASASSVGIIDREAGVLRTHHGPAVDGAVRARYSDPPLDAPLAFTEAARTGQPVLSEDQAAFAARFPESAATTSALGLGARAALPLRDSEGVVIGSIVHAWGGPRVFDDALVSTLLTIAEMAGQAIERTGLSEAEHRLVTTLQDSVLVPLPPAVDLDIAARYLPASQDIGMGGDWYEGIALDEHRYALIVGDVAGHGITAVGEMAQLRAVIGALVRIDTPIDVVFAQTTELLQAAAHSPTASALLMIVDTATCTLTYATAGHPPPIIRRPGEDAEVLDDGRQPILGIPVHDGERSEVPFPRGSLLTAYTDGLIEQRGEPIDISLERLRKRVGALDGDDDAEAIADGLLSGSLTEREPVDDVALVVIRHVRS